MLLCLESAGTAPHLHLAPVAFKVSLARSIFGNVPPLTRYTLTEELCQIILT